MPVHVVTFLLTEVVDSVRRWEDDEPAMTAATEQLDAVVRRLVAEYSGTQVKPRGEGDSHFLVFEDPADAVACAVALQRAMADDLGLPVRSAAHVGAAEFREGDWYGTTVNRCARLRAAAHARQAVASADVAAAVEGRGLPDGVSLRSLGRHRLKDLDEPAEVFQICAPALVPEHPPLATLARTHGLDLPRSSFVGRSAQCEQAVTALAGGGIVTVTGPPGVGTTRFATETAANWWERDGRRVRVVADGGPPDALATARLVPGELVLVHDVSDVAVAALTGPAIVTARRPLGAAHETVVRLAPLDDFDAEVLLKERLSEDMTLPTGMARFCDGLPLAIELLARRASSVDASVLAERLSTDPLAVLGGDRRAEPARHASVRATLAAAYGALGPVDQAELLVAAPGDPWWVEAGWHEPDGPLPLVARFLGQLEQRR
ncbi:MAG TPA: hypothetical protein VMZ22_08530 [Acidimicrobiales bacterium]|nr:hypothetical protein [Acidimicrobiales bacterium]